MSRQCPVSEVPLLMDSPRKFNRQCVACRDYFKKSVLLKLTKPSSSPNLIVLNPSSSIFGRSLYCCNKQNCLNKLLSKQGKFLKQRLKTSVLPATLMNQLEQHLQAFTLES
jgi:predicted RNA-binding protein YlxR (DUF448 family)